MSKAFCLIVILCVVIGINCWSSDNCDGCRSSEYTRNKRAKYQSIPSYKYYNRYTNRGPVYTPNDFGPAMKLRPYKVSKRPINEGLGDEEFNKLMNYLSSKDLNRIVEKYSDMYRDHGDNYEFNGDFSNTDYEDDSSKMYSNRPNSQFDYNKYNSFEYRNPSASYLQMLSNMNNMYSQVHMNTDDSEETEQLSLLDEYIRLETSGMSKRNNIFTDSKTMTEEELPNPINLRDDDYDGSFTNNMPTVAKPETAYKLENFANLPLMEYENWKPEKVNSYSVPHYSVTSPSNHRQRLPSLPQSQSSPSLPISMLSVINVPEVEPAPPVSTAKEQSDAHLKAIKIWTHKSKGTAYTLHDDGTLSLEKPARPRHKLQ